MSLADSALSPEWANEHAYWWNATGEWVEPPNVRRNGWSGVLRVPHGASVVYVKRQFNHLCRTWRHPLGWPTASRECFYLNRVRGLGVRAPLPLFHGSVANGGGMETVLVTEALDGFAPLAALDDAKRDEREMLAREVGAALGVLHRNRMQHSCLYDKHIMVRRDAREPEIALLDLEKMRMRPTRAGAAEHDLNQLRRHQRVWSSEEWRLLVRSHHEAMTRATSPAPLMRRAAPTSAA